MENPQENPQSETDRLQEKVAKQKIKQIHNLSPKILIALLYCKDLNYKKLGELTQINEPTKLRTYIQRLTKKELLEKERISENTDDIRKTLSLTEKGVEEAKKYLEYINSKKELIVDLEIKKYIHDSWQEKLKEYLNRNDIKEQLSECKIKHSAFSIDHYDMAEWNPQLADHAIERPQEFFIVCRNLIHSLHDFVPYIKFVHITDTIKIPISKISKKHLDKLHSFEGIIKFFSDNTPYTERIQWCCNACGFKWWEMIQDNIITKPKKCANITCRGIGSFFQTDDESHDRHYLLIEESHNQIEGNKQPHSLLCYVERELTDDTILNKILPGRKVKINGIVKKKPTYKFNKQTNEFRLIVKVSNVEILEGDLDDLKLTPEENEFCNQMFDKMQNSFDEGFKLLCKNFNPLLISMNIIKEAVMLQMIAGSDIKDENNMEWRNKIHILLVGDPGTGKTKLARYICSLLPYSRMAIGTGSSGVGITASVRKEAELGIPVIEGGKIVMASGSLCAIDEFDKLHNDDKNKLLECMENSSITIDKAGLSRTLPAETCILALANPVSGDFSSPKDMLNEINLPPMIRQRFDLIFIMREFNTEEMDSKIARVMIKQENPIYDVGFNHEFLKKYFKRLRDLPEPSISDEGVQALEDYFVRLRSVARKKYGGTSTAIGKRILNTYQRLSRCYAKFRGDDVVKKIDVDRSHKIICSAFKWALTDEEGGVDMELDTSLLFSDESKVEIDKRQGMRRVFNEVCERIPNGVSSVVLIEAFKNKGFSEVELWDLVKFEKSKGNVFEVNPDKFVLNK